MAQDRIPLGELLEYIAGEIRDIHRKTSAQGEPVMKFKECELEFGIEAENKAEGGFHVWVLKLGGGVKRTEANTIKIKYTALDDHDMVAQLEAPPQTCPKPTRQGRRVK